MALTDAICWLNMDQASNTTRTDSSGNGNNFLSNGSVPAVSGVIRNAAEFNGTAGNYLSNASQLIPNGTFSISLWFNLNAVVAGQDIWGQGPSGTSYQVVGIRAFGRVLGVTFDVNANVVTDFVIVPATAGTWHHFVGCFNSVTGFARSYLDGIYAGEIQHTFNETTGMINAIGSAPGGSANNISDGVDLFGLWLHLLTDGGVTTKGQTAGGEVAQLYNSGFGFDPYSPFQPAWNPARFHSPAGSGVV